MTSQQRQKAQARAALRAATDKFIDQPCRLSAQQTRALLHHLCSKLGYCLAPADYQVIEADPPTDPRAFAQLVMELEGVSSADPAMFTPVLELVLAAFEGVARDQ